MNKLFQVTRVTSDLVAIITGTQTTTGAAGGGACSVIPYERVGPAAANRHSDVHRTESKSCSAHGKNSGRVSP